MDPADMNEVFKRLGEQQKRFLDECHSELPVPDAHKIEPPLFERRPQP